MIKFALAAAIISVLAWASPSEDDFAQCEKHHSRATCAHSLLP
jgi:hypothetical protein